MNWELRKTNQEDIWMTNLENGEKLEWKGFEVGPLALSQEEKAALCKKLLGIDIIKLKEAATKVLKPFRGDIEKSLIMHCTTSDLGSLRGDISELRAGIKPKNHSGYTETRSPFLGKPGDLAIGRMESWKISASKAGVEQLIIPNLSHYYLSDALILLAAQHQENPQPCLLYLIDYIKKNPKIVVRIYVSDVSVQLFLTWLKQLTGLNQIYFDANSPEVAKNWNNKNVLYPTVAVAKTMDLFNLHNPYEILQEEQKESLLSRKLGLNLPSIPGYVIERTNKSLSDFYQQTLEAAQLLQDRYGLRNGCLKACEAGDGARITPNINLSNHQLLEELAIEAYTYGDDYVLESHFYYETTTIGKQKLNLTPSAHIRSGRVAEGITLQLTRGTTWVGNMYIDEKLAPKLGISKIHFLTIKQVMSHFLTACRQHEQGLAIGGIDFAIGRVGGKFGEDVILGIQDPNISFNGAEFLREFMNRTSVQKGWKINSFYAVTWIFIPMNGCSHDVLECLLKEEALHHTHTAVIAIVPNSWAMIGVAALKYEVLVQYLEHLQTIIARQFIQQEKVDILSDQLLTLDTPKGTIIHDNLGIF